TSGSFHREPAARRRRKRYRPVPKPGQRDAFVAMPTAKRGDDVKVIVAATLAVLAFGGLIFAGIYFSTRGGKSPQCGQLSLGSAESVRREITDAGGPWFQTGGGSCSFWLALNGGQIVAYKLHIPGRDCTVTWSGSYRCGGEVVAESE